MAQTLRWRDILPGIFQGVPWLNGYWGSRWLWTVALMADAAFEGIHLAVRGRWIGGDHRAPDAIDEVGAERSIIRRNGFGATAAETDDAYAARIVNAWDYWQSAGGVQRMQDEIRGLGLTTATIYRPAHRGGEWSRPGPNGVADYWSIFWVLIAPDDPGLVGYDPGAWGYGTWGTGTWGVDERVAAVRNVARALKPITWIGEVIVVTDGGVWGAHEAWGDPGLTWGGESVVASIP